MSFLSKLKPAAPEAPAPIEPGAFEWQALEVARYFFVSFAQPTTHAWMEGFWRAEQMFPAPFGATIAHTIVIAIRELQTARARPLEFNCPACARNAGRVTAEERHFMVTLAAIRSGNKTAAATHALLLCESEDTSGFLEAVERLAIMTGDVSPP